MARLKPCPFDDVGGEEIMGGAILVVDIRQVATFAGLSFPHERGEEAS